MPRTGRPEEVGLQLLLRVVADAGIVGLPNAGKSSLLAAITRASPDIAPYPFTTLMPNLGVVSHGDPSLGGSSSVLADLPGLIRRAHKGVGLGRAFLRHLSPVRKKNWVVYAKPPFAGPQAELAYLSRYTHRVAISNSRLIRFDDTGVTFRYKD